MAPVRKTALPEPQVEVLVDGLEVDASWPRARLIVELDSRRFHSSPWAFERDRHRDADLQRAGYRVVRITHRRLDSGPAGVIELIGELVA